MRSTPGIKRRQKARQHSCRACRGRVSWSATGEDLVLDVGRWGRGVCVYTCVPMCVGVCDDALSYPYTWYGQRP